MKTNADAGVNFTGDDTLNIENSIIVGGVPYDIGARVYNWGEEKGFNGYTTEKVTFEEEDRRTGKLVTKTISGKRYGKRKGGVNDITQFLIHHSGGDGRDPSNMYQTLYNRRGLSVQYAVEDDGRIFQFNDALDLCWHAGKHNRISVGVECCLYPDADRRPHYYSAANRLKRGNLPHTKRVEVIQGMKKTVFCFTKEQTNALARLAAGTWIAVEMQQGFGIDEITAPKFPRVKGDIPLKVFKEHMSHIGMLGHLHCTKRKWDPAGFLWEGFEALVEKYIKQFLEVGKSQIL